jgi:hypothetical protein
VSTPAVVVALSLLGLASEAFGIAYIVFEWTWQGFTAGVREAWRRLVRRPPEPRLVNATFADAGTAGGFARVSARPSAEAPIDEQVAALWDAVERTYGDAQRYTQHVNEQTLTRMDTLATDLSKRIAQAEGELSGQLRWDKGRARFAAIFIGGGLVLSTGANLVGAGLDWPLL